MSKKTTAYIRLKELLEESAGINPSLFASGKHTEWSRSVDAALKRMFGNTSEHLTALNQISYAPPLFTSSTPQSFFDECYMSGVQEARAVIRSAIKEFEDYEIEPDTTQTKTSEPKPTSRVFVVHGHDNEMKETVARFLEKIGFEPIILQEQANAGDTLIEKFERNSDVPYAIVLLSPDDVGNAKDKSEELSSRARQNVILELGYFVGKLGRPHVCALARGKLELPSDFHGVVYVPFDGDSWKLHIIREMKHLGFDVDANAAFT